MIEEKHLDTAEPAVSFLQPGLGGRIDAACKKIGTRSKAAAAVGVSEVMLRTYIRGDSSPRFDAMVNLAIAAEVDLMWLATGRENIAQGDKPAPGPAEEVKQDDEEIVRTIKLSVRALEEWLVEEHLELEAAKKAEVIGILYRYLRTRNTVNQQEITALLSALAA
ncbi:helix-turn-helix transcriptional regulator [Chromobacterium haemolyticum]|uniref:Helix-turn-helix transcriptional regulator n=1 Tax=Chromobacterium fluminis TaxID=3044269 RepID=A0ABX0L454_9NEIS|nr:helix-turn-helix domain-containing protein [Chromobacterium haemolyticum]NHR06490.1 helix-turn-helix transcriptional regulator [Chromobacterium haemolyticum]